MAGQTNGALARVTANRLERAENEDAAAATAAAPLETDVSTQAVSETGTLEP
jgi:hypothetical protein